MTAVGGNVWEISHWELIFRMVMAVVLGGLIGIEREWSNHAAGFRTHILVCLGSATIMLLSVYGFSQFVNETNVRTDPARLAAQVISGIGFLGAGAILRNGNMIKGLTTAASVWVVAAIGLSIGAGFYTGALTCTFLVLINLFLLNKWEKYLLRNRRYHEVDIDIVDHPGSFSKVASLLGEYNIQIVNLRTAAADPDPRTGDNAMKLQFTLKTQSVDSAMTALGAIAEMKEVLSLKSHKSGVIVHSLKESG